METNFFDRYGILHHEEPIEGDPETSENGPLFLGEWIVEKRELSQIDAVNFLASVCFLFDPIYEQWVTTPISSVEAGFSHDNFKGVVAGLLRVKKEFPCYTDQCNKILKKVPLFHRQLIHPRDFIIIGYAKFPILFFPFLWIPMIAFWVSCWESFKVRGGNKIKKTDGKIICRIMCKSMNLKFTYFIANKLTLRWRNDDGKWRWQSWFHVYSTYFKNKNHPILKEIWD